MIYLKISNIKLHMDCTKQDVVSEALRIAKVPEKELESFKIIKYSIDARKKDNILKQFTVLLSVKRYQGKHKNVHVLKELPKYTYEITGKDSLNHPPVVVGFGPAGMFCSYLLALNGYRPIIIERGSDVEQRIHDVNDFWRTGNLNPNSNVQFGEGGAGTFSDGKLNTGIKDKFHRIDFVLNTFVRFGAAENITYDAKPHIGTDVLCDVVKRMREEIIRLGGHFLFQTQVTDFKINNGILTAVEINEKEWIETELCVLAIGHSARDTFRKPHQRGVFMEQKPFAMGVRVEHSQEMINQSQYGFPDNRLGAAPYKLTYHTKKDRGVYSFCMCPGGYVVNSSSQEGKLCINGMSYQKRDSANANSAIVTTVTPKDFATDHPLSGMELQEEIEEKTYAACEGKIPVQCYGDFVNHKKTTSLGMVTPCVKGSYELSDLNEILPDYISDSIREAMGYFGTVIQGFDREDTVMLAVESRTSSPVRIVRNEFFQSNIQGLLPAGEGAGYAGGITSAAIDGMKIFENIVSRFRPFE